MRLTSGLLDKGRNKLEICSATSKSELVTDRAATGTSVHRVNLPMQRYRVRHNEMSGFARRVALAYASTGNLFALQTALSSPDCHIASWYRNHERHLYRGLAHVLLD